MSKKHFISCWISYAFVIFVIIFAFVFFKSKSEFSLSSLKNCIKKAGEQNLHETDIFFQESQKCIHSLINIANADRFDNGVINEKKVFLPLKIVNNFQEECIWLTIGIGGNALAETLFHRKYPQCKIFGVEPGPSGNFSLIGTVIPSAIGLTDKLNDDTEADTKKALKTISLINILDNYVHSRFVYYLTIDIEGYEYKILNSLVGNGENANEGITFCQIDAELHNVKMDNINPEVKNLNPVKFVLDFLQDSSPYIPIFNEPYTYHPHQKVTFINIADPRCEQAFLFRNLFK